MFLKGKHIYLRALEPGDVNTLYTWENDTSIWQVSNTQTPFSKFVLEQFLANQHNDIYTNRQLRLIACLHGSDDPIGAIDLFDFEPFHLRAGIGILITEAFRRNGYASEVLQLVRDYAFNTLLLKQLYCNVGTANEPSIRLFEKNGFVKCGLKENWNRIGDNQFEDEWMLQLVKNG